VTTFRLGRITRRPRRDEFQGVLGTRLGIWIPRSGVNFGSRLQNGIFAPNLRKATTPLGCDFNYHRGTTGLRDRVRGNQHKPGRSSAMNPRQGLYTKIAYRKIPTPRRISTCRGSRSLRYGFANIQGIDRRPSHDRFRQAHTGTRDQEAVQVPASTYYFYRQVIEVAYEINREHVSTCTDDGSWSGGLA